MTVFARLFCDDVIKNEDFSDFQFSFFRFTFLTSLREQVIKFDEKVLFVLGSRTYSSKIGENTENCENTIFDLLWTLTGNFKLPQISLPGT